MLKTLILLAQFHSLTPTSDEPIMPPTYSWEDTGQTSGLNPGFTSSPAISNFGSGGGGGTGGLAAPPPVVNDFGNMR
jgi:hypothetical protein